MIRRALGTLLGFALGFGVIAIYLATTDVSNVATADAEPGPSRVERLIERYDCWTDANEPPEEIPAYSIVTLPGQRAERLPAVVGFGIWLDGKPGQVWAFCPGPVPYLEDCERIRKDPEGVARLLVERRGISLVQARAQIATATAGVCYVDRRPTS